MRPMKGLLAASVSLALISVTAFVPQSALARGGGGGGHGGGGSGGGGS
ncbi:MAG: hypothetical protein ACK5Q5_24755 [Planctomycetaceae bacterium]